MHPDLLKIKQVKHQMLNDFTGFYTKPKNLDNAIIDVLKKYQELCAYDVTYSLSPHFFRQDTVNSLNDLVRKRIINHDVIRDRFFLR